MPEQNGRIFKLSLLFVFVAGMSAGLAMAFGAAFIAVAAVVAAVAAVLPVVVTIPKAVWEPAIAWVVLAAVAVGSLFGFYTQNSRVEQATAGNAGTAQTDEDEPVASSTRTTTPSTDSSHTTTTTNVTIDNGGVTGSMSVQYLDDLIPVDSRNSGGEEGLSNLSGETYTRYLILATYYYDAQAYYEYDIGRDYARLQGDAGLRDDSPAGTQLAIQIYGDGVELLNEQVGLGEVVPVDIDVRNVLRLRIQITRMGEGDLQWNTPNPTFIFGNARLIP